MDGAGCPAEVDWRGLQAGEGRGGHLLEDWLTHKGHLDGLEVGLRRLVPLMRLLFLELLNILNEGRVAFPPPLLHHPLLGLAHPDYAAYLLSEAGVYYSF